MSLAEEHKATPPITLSLERLSSGYRRGDETDSSLWLAFCGGGMSAAHNVGKAIAAAELGLHEVVDGVCGDSAGAFIGAAFVSNQLPLTYKAFVEDLPKAGLIDFRRALRGKRVLNLEVLDELIQLQLDVDALINPDTPSFGFAYTNLRKQEPVFVYSDASKDPEELRSQLMWGAHMPLVAGIPPRNKDGDPIADAGLSLKATREIATHGGATHVIEGSTTKKHTWEQYLTKTLGVGLWLQIFGNSGGIRRYKQFTDEQIAYHNQEPPVNVAVIYPASSSQIAPTLTSNSELVKKTIDAGFESMMAAYGYETDNAETPQRAKEKLIHYMGYGVTAKTFALGFN